MKVKKEKVNRIVAYNHPNGKPHFVIVKWPEGQTYYMEYLDDEGKRHGRTTYWNRRGEMTIAYNYVHGVREGTQSYFHPSTNEQKDVEFKNDKKEQDHE